ncbi:class I SAM-dependent methyltransferase [Paenibacillus sp. HN-1]|uniref:class I SAM-dependent methyltransferase n=1 Tax=Paenibacillus TaxID=44249 RepID=UPI001CA82603|nr:MULTISPECIES: class I SAM-dependent methyltransferase [Paenibacillus]MBY9082526.1 class I SAM-dependent methyltransferase [Paenibacillus sp. CGMCC 1.18879]MBY9084885.1 class I SAM-dependent methyltransferase [Paenibacillus sinensis]
MSSYWNDRFAKEGMIWGTEPSPTANIALGLFREHGVRRIWVPGAGYGRNTRVFSREFEVEGTELSEAAVKLAKQWDPDSSIEPGSVLDRRPGRVFDAVYGYDVLHLFLEQDRRILVSSALEQLRPGGLLFFTCFSDNDAQNGQGTEMEPGTYEYKQGKYAHFFTERDLRDHFHGTEVLETGELREVLTSGPDGVHAYILRFILARKT